MQKNIYYYLFCLFFCSFHNTVAQSNNTTIKDLKPTIKQHQTTLLSMSKEEGEDRDESMKQINQNIKIYDYTQNTNELSKAKTCIDALISFGETATDLIIHINELVIDTEKTKKDSLYHCLSHESVESKTKNLKYEKFIAYALLKKGKQFVIASINISTKEEFNRIAGLNPSKPNSERPKTIDSIPETPKIEELSKQHLEDYTKKVRPKVEKKLSDFFKLIEEYATVDIRQKEKLLNKLKIYFEKTAQIYHDLQRDGEKKESASMQYDAYLSYMKSAFQAFTTFKFYDLELPKKPNDDGTITATVLKKMVVLTNVTKEDRGQKKLGKDSLKLDIILKAIEKSGFLTKSYDIQIQHIQPHNSFRVQSTKDSTQIITSKGDTTKRIDNFDNYSDIIAWNLSAYYGQNVKYIIDNNNNDEVAEEKASNFFRDNSIFRKNAIMEISILKKIKEPKYENLPLKEYLFNIRKLDYSEVEFKIEPILDMNIKNGFYIHLLNHSGKVYQNSELNLDFFNGLGTFKKQKDGKYHRKVWYAHTFEGQHKRARHEAKHNSVVIKEVDVYLELTENQDDENPTAKSEVQYNIVFGNTRVIAVMTLKEYHEFEQNFTNQ